jgi:hypothetical protein
MLLYSSLFHVIAIQMFVLMIHHQIWPSVLPDWFVLYNFIVASLSLICNHLQATIANGRSFWYREGWFYTLAGPFFSVVKTLIVFVSLYKACRGQRRWVVTRRDQPATQAKRAVAIFSKSI